MIIDIKDFNLKDTVTCGQIFRFEIEEDNSYTVILSDRIVNLKQENNKLIIESSNMENIEQIIKQYFDLEYDYNKINNTLLKIDPNNKKIIESCIGLKMINEPRFELIISFILSANNGVPQIRNSLNKISEKFGKKITFKNKEYYLFPTIEELENATTEDFRNCKAGFRDKYIYEFIKKVLSKEINLDIIESMDSTTALNYLMANKGIGEKVASCILLFGYHRFDVFPIDTWVKKYMKDKHNLESIKDIRNFMYDKYKENCGLIIQYVFHYSRNVK